MQHSTGPTALPTTTYSTCVRQTMSHSFACSTPMIQAGTTAQPSPALVECQQPSRTHPVNATVLLHNPDNRFAASHTLYNSAPQLSVAARRCATRGIPDRWHPWYLPSPCPRRVSPVASRCGTYLSHASQIATFASGPLQHACPALPCHIQHQSQQRIHRLQFALFPPPSVTPAH